MSQTYGRSVPGSLRLPSITGRREQLSRPSDEIFRPSWADSMSSDVAASSAASEPAKLLKSVLRTAAAYDRLASDRVRK
jgi:hypothetical protein